jgi:hypothetical protein
MVRERLASEEVSVSQAEIKKLTHEVEAALRPYIKQLVDEAVKEPWRIREAVREVAAPELRSMIREAVRPSAGHWHLD